MSPLQRILVVNAGSSSVKLRLLDADDRSRYDERVAQLVERDHAARLQEERHQVEQSIGRLHQRPAYPTPWNVTPPS